MRTLSLQIDGRSFEFRDDYKNNAMLCMLSAFIDSVEKGERYSNLDLAISVTQTLSGLSSENKI